MEKEENQNNTSIDQNQNTVKETEKTDENIKSAMKTMSRVEGIDACPEGAATFAALDQLMLQSEIYSDEDVVLFNTGTGLKHPELR